MICVLSLCLLFSFSALAPHRIVPAACMLSLLRMCEMGRRFGDGDVRTGLRRDGTLFWDEQSGG